MFDVESQANSVIDAREKAHHHHHHHYHHGGSGHHHHHHHHHHGPVTPDTLAGNIRQADQNRLWLQSRGVRVFNLVSLPGAGKTTLLERTIREIGPATPLRVIEGHPETMRDSERIRAAGGTVVQLNPSLGPQPNATMLADAINRLDPPAGSIVLVENDRADSFDLGEQTKVVVASVSEGHDKPLKYPEVFRAADLVLVSKIDLSPQVDFKFELFEEALRPLNAGAPILRVSAVRGDGLAEWCQWLRQDPARVV